MLTYSCQALGDGTLDMAIYTFGADGRLNHEVWFEAPWPGVVHDFGATDEHFIVPFFPLITDMEVVKRGGTFYEWHDDKPCTWRCCRDGARRKTSAGSRDPTPAPAT